MGHHGFDLKGGTTFFPILYFVLSYGDYNDDTPLGFSNGIGHEKLEDLCFYSAMQTHGANLHSR